MTTSPEIPAPESTPLRTDDGADTAALPGAYEPGADETGADAPLDATAGPDSRTTDAALDAHAYDRLVEPRSANRLELTHGTWHQISRSYLWVQLISSGMILALVIVTVLVLTLALGQTWALIPGGIVAVLLLWTIAILPRQVRAIGYQLRDDDLVFRRGILWQRMVAVPYGRMQLVDITHGPLDRGFGIAQLKFVTAAATTGVTIPGLTQAAAETLRDHLIAVAESRRTGL